MGEMYDYFEDFPEENPGNWVNGRFDPQGAAQKRESEAKLARECKEFRDKIQKKIEKHSLKTISKNQTELSTKEQEPEKLSLNSSTSLVLKLLNNIAIGKRPKRRNKLKNWITAHLHSINNPAHSNEILKELEKNGFFTILNKTIKYK